MYLVIHYQSGNPMYGERRVSDLPADTIKFSQVDGNVIDVGDEDVNKPVCYCNSAVVHIDKSIAHHFKGVNELFSIRLGYFNPAYEFRPYEDGYKCERIDLDNGDIEYHITH